MNALSSLFARVKQAVRPLKRIGLSILLIGICIHHNANAQNYGYVTGATILKVAATSGPRAFGTNSFLFFINQPVTTPAACGSQTAIAPPLTRFAIDPTTPGGVAQIAIVLSAMAEGKTVDIQGLGVCNVWGDTETAWYIVTD